MKIATRFKSMGVSRLFSRLPLAKHRILNGIVAAERDIGRLE